MSINTLAFNKPMSLQAYITHLDASTSLGVDGDLASQVLAHQIKTQDKEVNVQIGHIRLIAKARKMLNAHLDGLRSTLAWYKGETDDMSDKKTVHEGPADGAPFLKWAREFGLSISFEKGTVNIADNGRLITQEVSTFNYSAWSAKYDDENPPPRGFFEHRTGPDYKFAAAEENLDAVTWTAKKQGAEQLAREQAVAHRIDGNTLEKEIKRLESRASELDSDRELRMIQLNSSISRRGTMIELLNKVSKSTNDSARVAVAGNR